MNKKHFFKIVKLPTRETILSVTFAVFTLGLIIFSSSNISAAKKGLTLWANSVVPSLLPFFIATELLSHTPAIDYLGRLLNRFMRPLFHVPGLRIFSFYYGYNKSDILLELKLFVI